MLFRSDFQFFITTQVKDYGGGVNVVHEKASKSTADVGFDLEIFQMVQLSVLENTEVAILQQFYTGSNLLQRTPNSGVEAWFRLGFTIFLTSLPLPLPLGRRPLGKHILRKIIKTRMEIRYEDRKLKFILKRGKYKNKITW